MQRQDDYDGKADAFAGYEVAVSEIRRRGVASGEFEPTQGELAAMRKPEPKPEQGGSTSDGP